MACGPAFCWRRRSKASRNRRARVSVAGEPRQHRARPIEAHQPRIVAELRSDARSKLVGVRGRFHREVRRAELHGEIERPIGRRHHLVEQIAPGQEVQDLAHERRWIVDDPDVHALGHRRLPQIFEKRQHALQILDVLWIGVEEGVDVEDEGFGGRERRRTGGQRCVARLPNPAGESPAVRIDPGDVGRARDVRQEPDSRGRDGLKRGGIRAAGRRTGEAPIDERRCCRGHVDRVGSAAGAAGVRGLAVRMAVAARTSAAPRRRPVIR